MTGEIYKARIENYSKGACVNKKNSFDKSCISNLSIA